MTYVHARRQPQPWPSNCSIALSDQYSFALDPCYRAGSCPRAPVQTHRTVQPRGLYEGGPGVDRRASRRCCDSARHHFAEGGYRAQMRRRLVDHGDVVHPGTPRLKRSWPKFTGMLPSSPSARRWSPSRSTPRCTQAVTPIAPVKESDGLDRLRERRHRAGRCDDDAARSARVAHVASSTLTVIGRRRRLDSGIAPNADFSGRITAFYDLTQGGMKAVAPTTTTVGTRRGPHRQQRRNPMAIYRCRAERAPGRHQGARQRGQGSTSDVISALEFVTNRNTLDVQIINMSLGHPIFAPAANDPGPRCATSHGHRADCDHLGGLGVSETTGCRATPACRRPASPSAICVGAA